MVCNCDLPGPRTRVHALRSGPLYHMHSLSLYVCGPLVRTHGFWTLRSCKVFITRKTQGLISRRRNCHRIELPRIQSCCWLRLTSFGLDRYQYRTSQQSCNLKYCTACADGGVNGVLVGVLRFRDTAKATCHCDERSGSAPVALCIRAVVADPSSGCHVQ